MCVCVCVCWTRARVSCSIAVKLAVVAGGGGGVGGCRGSGYSGVDVALLAVCRELSVYFRYVLRGLAPFQNIVPVDFHSLPDLIGCRPTFEFKPTIIILAVAVTWLLRASGDRRRAS